MPAEVGYTCPYCGKEDRVLVAEKTTVVCVVCQVPHDLYEDGRLEWNALFDAEGRVTYTGNYRNSNLRTRNSAGGHEYPEER